ncbi:SDR family oxidoreductase [Candidatus Pacebacteria bacterium]|nr:SDR family oxidoreductase [Candidatus Paceibacterota bacterium]
MKGKTGIVMGALSTASLGFHIAQMASNMGANIILTYAGDERIQAKVAKLGKTINAVAVYHCDVADPESMDTCFDQISNNHVAIDFLVHSIAYAERDELKGPFMTNTSLEGFQKAFHISCFSLIDVARRVEPRMVTGGSITTLSFYAAQRVFANYNVMAIAKAALEATVRQLAVDLGPRQIRVNAVSASPARTLAAAGIANFHRVGGIAEAMSPQRRLASKEEIAAAIVFLMTDGGAAFTGAILPANCGAEITAHAPPWNAAFMKKEMEEVEKINFQHVGKEK